MSERDSGDITQKDLLKLLFDQAQHNATREELNALGLSLNQRIDKLETKVDKLESKFDDKFSLVDSKFNRLNLLLITTLVGVIANLAIQLLK
ncbi:hypothetical protein [Vibrio cyclitrophicus]|uniref:DUF1640 domain-containing protein n=2 Tax=Vibrio cyclitrophicus TaxID=47951 RepID=A0A7Z1S441_9VIBR|nr:hypothetical protein [Vibrio cyclitrophicus]PMP21117.1 hypothetical protein BCS91_20510 [Vibrio cyclitrophicus]PMP30537.1 hypothetical protein BCS90_14645 [Vibrio cyclitrophicus]